MDKNKTDLQKFQLVSHRESFKNQFNLKLNNIELILI